MFASFDNHHNYIRACSAIANKIFCTGTNKVTQGENGGKADKREISRTVTCDGHRHRHSSRVAWGLDDMWGFGRCHAQKYFTMQIRASERWCCRIFEHFSEVHDIYPKLENILVQNILFLLPNRPWYFSISNKISFFILNTYLVDDILGEAYVPSKHSQYIFTSVSWDVCSE